MSKIPNFKMYSKLYGCICNMLSDVFFAYCMPQESSIQLIWFYFFLCVIYVIDVFDWYLANDMLKLIRVVIVKYAVGFWIYQIWYSPIKIIWDHSTSFNNDVRYGISTDWSAKISPQYITDILARAICKKWIFCKKLSN